MLFDQDPEIGAFLFLNLDRNKIEGYLYREDKEETEVEYPEYDEDDKPTGKMIKRKEVSKREVYVMDVQGNWYKTTESTNPFIFMLPELLGQVMIGDKAKIPWDIYADTLADKHETFKGMTLPSYKPDEELEGRLNNLRQPDNATAEDIAKLDAEAAEINKLLAEHSAKFRVNYEMLKKSEDWIRKNLKDDKDGKDFDPLKKLLRELDKFEYDIGEKK